MPGWSPWYRKGECWLELTARTANYYEFDTIISRDFLSFLILQTSIAESVAAALGRKFYRFSVGGMSDVSEIKVSI